MQRAKKYLLIILFLSFIVFTISARTTVWSENITLWINNKINNTGWTFNAKDYSGYLVGSTVISNINVKHKNGTKIYIDKIVVNPGIIASIFGDLVLDFLTIENIDLNYINNQELLPILDTNNYTKTNFPLQINSFFMNGKVITELKEANYIFNFTIGGEIKGEENNRINCDLFKVSLDNDSIAICNFNKLELGHDLNLFYLKNLEGEIYGLPIIGNIYVDKSFNALNGRIDVRKFSFPEELLSNIPLKTKFSTFTGQFNFNSDFKNYTGELALENQLGLDMVGNFHFTKENNIWLINEIKMQGENSKLVVNGLWKENDRMHCYMNLDNLDFSRWIKDQDTTSMSGLCILDASLTNDGALDQIEMTLEILESKLFNQGEISIHGQFSYKDSIIQTIDPVMLLVDNSFLTIDGKGDFKEKDIEFFTDMEKVDIELINNFLPGDFISGKATGSLKVNGNFYSPSAMAELICEDVAISEFNLKSIELNSNISINDSVPSGYFDIKAGHGSWSGRSFDSGTVSALIKNKTIVVENCHFKSGNDFLQASGEFNGINQYIVNRIQFAYQDNYLINSKPIRFFMEDTVFVFEPFEFHINDGVLEGVVNGSDGLECRLKMSNFDSKVLTQFLEDERLKFSGLIFGEIWLKSNGDDFDLDTDLSLKKGIYMNESFDEMALSCLYKNGILHIDDISMTRRGQMGIQANGIIPIKKINKQNSISLKSSFSNLSLEFIHRFIPKFYSIKGNATGNIEISGTPNETQFDYGVTVYDSFFDLIELGVISSRGNYDGKKLIVEYANSKHKNGLVSSYGVVPFDLNISSSKFGKILNNEKIELFTNADIKNLFFLSPYIDELDSAKGEFHIELLLSGKGQNIVRSGKIEVQNGELNTLLISDPISSINGFASMENNQLKIDNLNLVLLNSDKKGKIDINENTKISGVIDFSSFFNPKYDLKIKGDNVSYKLLFIDVFGESNINLSLSGRDTVLIDGKVEVLDANVFYEFLTEEVGTAFQKEDHKVIAYNFNIPITGNAKFQNSQIDANLTGEINLSQIGNQEIDFGGQIIVEDGNVNAYTDNFENLQGIVNFDNKGFNPNIDVTANTMIDNERIDLRMKGGIKDLDIILESASGFSESDILELLTWGKRWEEQEWTSSGFGNQTVSILGTILENQLEKNIKESNLGMMDYVDDINISGAAGLLQGADEDYEVTVKTKLSDKTFLNLSYKRSFSLNEDRSQTSQIGVEYKLNRHFSLVGAYDKEGNLNLKYRYRYAY